MTRARILIVEDELAISEMIAVNLRHQGYDVVCVEDGEQAQQELDSAQTGALPDVILLDWMLPGQNGLTLARKWRSQARTKAVPILMLTARGDERDKITGLDAGADDYLTKPFSIQELLARIRAILRRTASEQTNETLQAGALTLDLAAHRALLAGQPVKLGPTEFKLLSFLMRNPERVHTRNALLDKVWGDQVYIEERTVDVHIKRLREALGGAAGMLETVRGVGYRFTSTPGTAD